MALKKILFIDRDGTLIKEPSDFQVDSLEKIEFMPYVFENLRKLAQIFELVMVTNQDGLGSSSFPEADFLKVQDFVLKTFESQGVRFSDIRICPHFREDNCQCRKPSTGLVRAYQTKRDVSWEESCVIGDRPSDAEFSDNLGIRFLDIRTEGGWNEIASLLLNSPRRGICYRKTRETEISVQVCLEKTMRDSIDTPYGFFTHMLEQIAGHGNISLQINAAGDTHIDCHHLVEDTALVLGEALRKALGDKYGTGRYGFTLPMDESLCQMALDLSGRPYFVIEGKISTLMTGGIASEMFPHFFRSISQSLGAALHIRISGENSHHMVESMFKAFGRCLASAAKRETLSIPSTKGVL